MQDNWKTYTLNDLVSKLGDGIHGTPKYDNNGEYFFVNGNNLIDGKIVIKPETKRVSKEEYEKHKRPLNDRTILVSINGTIGRVAEYNGENIMLGKSACYFNVIEGVNKNFIKQVVSSNYFINYIESNYTGSVIKNVSLRSMRELPINLPPLQEQRAIASILSALDDKIELNLQMNKTLEEMAMTLYKHWFVDFTPFKDGKFVESELGMIPEGWEVKKLNELITKLSKGTTPRKKDIDGLEAKIPFLKVKDISDDGSISTKSLEKIPKEVHEKQLKRSVLETNDLLFSIAGTIGRVSIVPEELDNSNCNQALAFIRIDDKTTYNSLVLYWLKSVDVQREIHSCIVQGVQANVSLAVLKDLEIVIPPINILRNWNDLTQSIIEKKSMLEKEIRTLIRTRDTLLPKLISGEVRVKDAENLLKDVL